MWCTQCHVAFCWRTGAMVTNGVIHNPHYFEWVRRTRGSVPRAPGDVPCGGGGLPNLYTVTAVLRRSHASVEDRNRACEVLRALGHCSEVELPRLRQEARAGPERNVDLRLEYLMQRIDRAEWRKKLQQREKKRERAFAVMQVYDMLVAAAGDIFRALMETVDGGDRNRPDRDRVDRDRPDRDRLDAHLRELFALQRFTNDSLDAISKRFNMRVRRVGNRYQ